MASQTLSSLEPALRQGDEEVTRRKAQINGNDSHRGPMWALDELGIDVPREFHPEQAREYPHSVSVDGTPVHLHQRVLEASNNPFDDSQTTWTVVGLSEDEISLADEQSWSRFTDVSHEEFEERFESVFLERDDGQKVPKWSY